MMPLAYAAILGGTLTLIGTTPNLILGAELAERNPDGIGLGMFEFSEVGVPLAAICIAYMATIGLRFLPSRADQERLTEANLPEEVARNYGFTTNLYRMKVVEQSKMVGVSIRDAGVRARYDLDVVLISRPGKLGVNYLHPQPDLTIQAGDELYLEGETEDAWRIAEEEILQFGVAGPRSLQRILGRGLTLAEVTLTPHSRMFGQTFRELNFQQRHGLNVISVWHHGRPVTTGTGDHELELGDSFMVSGSPAKVRELAQSADFVVLTDDSSTEDVRRAPLAIGLMLLAVIPPIFGWLPLAISAIGAALLMVGTGCISLQGAKHAVDFRVLFMIIGTIPLGLALDHTGVAARAAQGILHLETYGGTSMLLFCLFALSALIATMVNNGAAAVVLAPVAATIATEAGIPMNKTFLAGAFGASCAFVLPFGNQCALMVMGPGGYRAKDYVRAGVGITILMTIVTIGMLHLT